MTKNESKLVEIIEVLCESVIDTPCGCDVCPYADTINNLQCEVYDIIEDIKAGGNHE